MAMKPMTRRALAGLLAMLLLGLGCNPLLAPFQLFNMGDGHRPSEFEFYEKAKKAKHKDEITVAVLCYPGRTLAPEFIGSEQEIAKMFTIQVKAAFDSNKEKVKLVLLSDVEKFKRNHEDWKEMEASDICKYLKADYLIDMELASLSLYEPRSNQQLYRGQVRVNVKISDCDKNADDLFPAKPFEHQYPLGDQPIDASSVSPDAFRQKFFAKIATGLTRLFTGIPTDHEFQ
jgi:hypothetical protein